LGKDVYFVLGQKRGRSGSALLRGEQLSAIVQPTLLEAGHKTLVRVGVEGIENAIVIVNKTVLLDHGAEALLQLKVKGNKIIVDPIDLPMGTPFWHIPDAVLSSSVEQDKYIREHYPDRFCVYVPHHADLRLSSFENLQKNTEFSALKRCAYVGDPLQGRFLDDLERHGLLKIINATNRSGEWMKELQGFTFHYAVRPEKQLNGLFKPFTKGAVAAACGAMIICGNDDREAAQALGEQYPFYIDQHRGVSQVVASIAAILEQRDTKILRAASEAMKRLHQATSPEALRAVFKTQLLTSQVFR
jgi:hypothetical protein